MDVIILQELMEGLRRTVFGGMPDLDNWTNSLDPVMKEQIIELLEVLLKKMKPHGQPGRPKKEKDAA